MRIPADVAERAYGHAHFWERAHAHGITRGQFLTRSAGTFGALAGFSLLAPGLARAAATDPKPIPGGIQPFGPGTELFHVFLPGPGNEPSTITDFNGHVGVAEITGFGTKTSGGSTSRPFYDVDMRFMKGTYVGVDGRLHSGTFGFF